MRYSICARVAALTGTVLALLVSGLMIGTAPSQAFPGCPAMPVEGDCFLLDRVDSQMFNIPPGREGRIIAQGREACEYMTSEGVGPMEYGVWYSQNSGSNVLSQAARFGTFAAVAYCPSVLE